MQTVAEYRNRFPGAGFVIVGKGPTRFDFRNLADIRSPVIFLNEAVQHERHAHRAEESFFFAHEGSMRQLVGPEMRSTVVVPRSGAFDRSGKRAMLSALDVGRRAQKLVLYEWGGWFDDAALAGFTRERVALHRRLYLHSGTIHTAIHFAWLCGAAKIFFIGCDGWDRAYDPRLDVRSIPGRSYTKIRRAQDRECELLGIKAHYINEPRIAKILPAAAHFIWLGSPLPAWASENISRFAELHSGWNIKVWTDLPRDMPSDLYRIAADVEWYCSRSDILSYWLLHRFGGFYLDVDVHALRSFEPLRRYEAFAARQHDARINCAVLGSLPGRSAMAACLERIRGLARNGLLGHHRALFGPNMLTELFCEQSKESEAEKSPCPAEAGQVGSPCLSKARDGKTYGLAILPEHYFYPLIDGKETTQWLHASPASRQEMLAARMAKRQTDPSDLYCVHQWGVDGSGVRRVFGRGDALAYRLRLVFGEESILGAEVGVLGGRLSEHLLRLLPNVHLLLIDRWKAADPESRYAQSGDSAGQLTDAQMSDNQAHATERTSFAADRREILQGESAEIAAQTPDSSLHFVFLDADHTLEGVREDLRAWWPKIKPGGLLCGHDMDNPLGGCTFENPAWGVRRAVETFMTAHKLDPETDLELGGEFTWYIRKPIISRGGGPCP